VLNPENASDERLICVKTRHKLRLTPISRWSISRRWPGNLRRRDWWLPRWISRPSSLVLDSLRDRWFVEKVKSGNEV
jgi:hypothetical protein